VSREEKQTKKRTIRFPRPLETTQRSDALDFRLRRMHRFVDIILACVLVALAAGCSSPPANFYTLKGTVASPATTSSNLSVVVGPVSIPAMLDRPQMVLTTGPNQVAIDEFNRWAAPLQNIISRAVAENLTVMLGASLVTLFPDATSMDAAYRAVIDVQRFELASGDAATLDAVWLVRRMKDGASQTGRTTAREPAPEKDYAVLVAALNRAVGRLSQDIANAVRALDRGRSKRERVARAECRGMRVG